MRYFQNSNSTVDSSSPRLSTERSVRLHRFNQSSLDLYYTRVRSVCVRAGHDREPAKTAEPIEMSFGVGVDSGVDGGPDPHTESAFWGIQYQTPSSNGCV